MVFPLIAGAGLLAGGWLAGKSGGGGGIDLFRGVEIGTKKEQTSTTTSEQTTIAPTITRTYDYVYSPTYAIGSSDVTGAVTKKEQEISQTPTTSPAMTIIPTQLQGAGEIGGAGGGGVAGGGGINIYDIVIIGGIGLGAYMLLTKNKK